jgi:glycosyltransferase involved in cell wall biosynthesis
MKPNLLFINSITIYGGGEVWMITAMKEFIRKGYNVTFVCKNDAAIINHSIEAGIETIPINISGDLNPVTIFKLNNIFKKKSINIVIANTGKDLRLSGMASLFLKDIKVIARQGIDYPLKNNFWYKVAYKKLAERIVANSEATKTTMLKSAPWLIAERVKVIYNGINPELYKQEYTKNLRNEFGFDENDFVIGFVGRLSVQKGVQYALDAFKSVIEKCSNIHLLICGDGELRGDVEKFVSENKLESKIHLAGFRKDIPDIMKTIDVLLTPSLWEGFGIVLIEAMASGKACIAADTSSIPEIVEDGVNGFLVPPKDSQSIADSLIIMISDPQLVHQMGQVGIKTVNNKFTIDKMIKEYEKLF